MLVVSFVTCGLLCSLEGVQSSVRDSMLTLGGLWLSSWVLLGE